MADRISEWLAQLDLGAHVEAFEENEIDWDVLPGLDHELLKELGVTAIGQRGWNTQPLGGASGLGISPGRG